jgi:hypothetical protein
MDYVIDKKQSGHGVSVETSGKGKSTFQSQFKKIATKYTP